VVHHTDATNAYTHADLNIPQHVKAPDGIKIPADQHLLAIKAIYGTHQGAHVWYLHAKKVIEDCNFKATLSDPCVFTRRINGEPQIITLYVDDFLVCASTTADVKLSSPSFKSSCF